MIEILVKIGFYVFETRFIDTVGQHVHDGECQYFGLPWRRLRQVANEALEDFLQECIGKRKMEIGTYAGAVCQFQ